MKILNYNKKARAENHRKARNSKRTSPGDLTWTTATARRGGGPRGAGLRLQRRRAPPAQGGGRPTRRGCGDCRTLDTQRGAYRLPGTEADHVRRMSSSVAGSL